MAATGRLSSSDPNLQNIPIRSEVGRRIRKAFIPADGCVRILAPEGIVRVQVLRPEDGQRLAEETSDVSWPWWRIPARQRSRDIDPLADLMAGAAPALDLDGMTLDRF